MEKKSKIILVVGRKGTGKTSLVKTLLYDVRSRAIIYDRNNEYKSFGDLTTSFVELHQRVILKKFPIRFFNTNVEWFFSYLLNMTKFVLVVDELQLVGSAWNFSSGLNELIQRSRHLEMDFFGICQRPSQVHKNIRSQVDVVYTFNQNIKTDIDVLTIDYGIEPERVKSLEKYKYIKKEVGI